MRVALGVDESGLCTEDAGDPRQLLLAEQLFGAGKSKLGTVTLSAQTSGEKTEFSIQQEKGWL